VLVWRVPRGLEKQAYTASALLMECNWSAAVRNDRQLDLREASGILIEIRRGSDCCSSNAFRHLGSADALARRPHQDSTRPLLHPLAINSNGLGPSASHRPRGVKIEYFQQHYTSPPPAKKRRKCIGHPAICRRRTHPRANSGHDQKAPRIGPDSC
jgi:hypothetical protein